MARRRATGVGAPHRSAINPHGERTVARWVIAVGVMPLLIGVAAADPPPTVESLPQPVAKSGKPELETVTIAARRQRKLIERQISTFVSSITLSARDESLARWQEPICPLVAGMTRAGGRICYGTPVAGSAGRRRSVGAGKVYA